MSVADPIAALATQTQSKSNAANKGPSDLGIEDFLALMTAQLKNQDPMKPLDSTEFVAQLAQFGTVSGVQNMQASLANLTDSLRSAQALQGTALVGHEVLAPTEEVTILSGQEVRGAVDAPYGTAAIQIAVKDSSGQVVRNISLPAGSGITEFAWDGRDDKGAPVPTDTYEIDAIASVGGKSESLEVLVSGRVLSVTIDPAGTGLTLNTAGIGPLALSEVRRVM